MNINKDSFIHNAAFFFDNCGDPVVITTADADNHVIVYVNDAFTQMTGYEFDEVVGKKPTFLQGERTNRTVMERLKNCLKHNLPFDGSAVNYRKDGTPYYVQWKLNALYDCSGHPQYFMAIQRDLTSFKAIINRLKRTNQFFRNFLSGINLENEIETSEASQMLESAKGMFSTELVKNEHYVKSIERENNKELIELDDLFDFDESSDETSPALSNEKLCAIDYMAKTQLTRDEIGNLSGLVEDLSVNIESYCSVQTKESSHLAIIADIQELANIIFYIEEFIDLSAVLNLLATAMQSVDPNTLCGFEIKLLRALLADISDWVNGIFVHQTATDIHFWDASIVSSCNQIIAFVQQ